VDPVRNHHAAEEGDEHGRDARAGRKWRAAARAARAKYAQSCVPRVLSARAPTSRRPEQRLLPRIHHRKQSQ